MNNQAIAEFVQAVTGFGPVRAKALRDGKEARLRAAQVVVEGERLCIRGETDSLEIVLPDIEHISYAPEKQKFFVRMKNSLVELRPDND